MAKKETQICKQWLMITGSKKKEDIITGQQIRSINCDHDNHSMPNPKVYYPFTI